MFAPLLDKLSLGIPSSLPQSDAHPHSREEPLLAIEPKSLEEALADGTVKVTEVSAAGHVPELRVKNSGATPVLILDGEELVGAKQNRIVNVTVLGAAKLRDRHPGLLYRSWSMGLFAARFCRRRPRPQSEDSLAEGGVRQQEP